MGPGYAVPPSEDLSALNMSTVQFASCAFCESMHKFQNFFSCGVNFYAIEPIKWALSETILYSKFGGNAQQIQIMKYLIQKETMDLKKSILQGQVSNSSVSIPRHKGLLASRLPTEDHRVGCSVPPAHILGASTKGTVGNLRYRIAGVGEWHELLLPSTFKNREQLLIYTDLQSSSSTGLCITTFCSFYHTAVIYS